MSSLTCSWRELTRKMVSDPLPPEAVAAGWALGMFIGCAVPFGFQLVISVPLAIFLHVSKIGASVGTLVTNPLTIFFIYPAQTYVAFKLFFGSGELGALPETWTLQSVLALSGPVIASFFLGGFMLAAILTPLTYFAVRAIVRRHRRSPCAR